MADTMRAAVVSILAGNLDGMKQSRLPLFLFKTAFYFQVLLRKLGVKLPENGGIMQTEHATAS